MHADLLIYPLECPFPISLILDIIFNFYQFHVNLISLLIYNIEHLFMCLPSLGWLLVVTNISKVLDDHNYISFLKTVALYIYLGLYKSVFVPTHKILEIF